MCKYNVLAQSKKGVVRYCHDCRTYHLKFNNLIMNFDDIGFDCFKDNIEHCYKKHIKYVFNVDSGNIRGIFFYTSLEKLQLLFSAFELGELLSLMQNASLEGMDLIEFRI